ncbi:MAG TPA: hypothetical protein VFT82_02125 [Candidatus Paceibacterota bacterium]|nr:hypothetical protein [Candidatus Paceibacterota bacterium]
MKVALISIIALLIASGGYLAYYITTRPSNTPNQIACTMDAKLCPDGSYVGRIGPNCDFAQCPGTSRGTDATSSPSQ